MNRAPRQLPHRIERRRVWRRGLALAVACVMLPLAARAEVAFDIGELMRTLAQVKASEASFIERREVSTLDRPLESSGRLSFEAPDTFVRETLKPRRERLAVIGNELTISQGGRSRTVPLDSMPEAAVIVEAIRGTLTGNRGALEQHFGATVSGSAQRWTLELVPREAQLQQRVASVRIAGHEALLREVVVALPDGDRSVMTIAPATAPAPSASGAN